MFQVIKYGVDKVLKVNNDKLSGFTAKAYADVKQAAEKENVKLVLLSTTDSISFISSCSSSRSRLCIKCSWTTVSTTPFQVKERRSRTRHSTLQKIETVKVLGLAKLIQDFRNSFNTYRRGF
jgi:electron transfer flavoprotein alpha subunit